MSAKKKPLPPPADDALQNAMRRRLQPREDPAAAEAPTETRTSARSASPTTVRRSWYMPADSAAALQALVDDLHHETRRPKGEVLAAVIAVVLEHHADVRTRLET